MGPRKSDFHTSEAVPVGILLVGLLSLGACAAPGKPLIYVEPSAVSRHYGTMVVAPVKNGGMSAAQPELLERTGQRLRLKLKESGFAVQDDQASATQQNYLRVNAIMQKYEGGNAFGRWVGFGAGAATCTLLVDLVDGPSGKKIGDVATTQTIDSGGLYSVGAGDYIVDRCADSIASGIVEKLAPGGAGG